MFDRLKLLGCGTDGQRRQGLPHCFPGRSLFFQRCVRYVDAPHDALAGLLLFILADRRLHRLHGDRFHFVVTRPLAHFADGRNHRVVCAQRWAAALRADLELNHIARYLEEEYEFDGGFSEMRREADRLRPLIRKALIEELLENSDMSGEEIRESIEEQIDDDL